jgi:hypothetical protein
LFDYSLLEEMGMNKQLVIGIIILLLAVGLSGCVDEDQSQTSDGSLTFQDTFDSKFGSLRGSFEELEEQSSLGIFWTRPHPGAAIWNEIEGTQGDYNWEHLDIDVNIAHSLGVHPLITIWPYAEWDQNNCHSDLPVTPDPFGGILPERKGIPCDWQSYQNFLTTLVERYDGDGVDDVPDLAYPVNYFEIGNEPEMSGYNTFFQGTPSDYALLLEKSAEAIREANSDAKILYAGVASSANFSEDFWMEVFSTDGIDDFFDIANVHDLAVTDDGNVGFMKRLLEENNIFDKEIWITEFRLYGGPGQEEVLDPDELKDRINSTFATGAQKIFLLLPGYPEEMSEELVTVLEEIITEFDK